MPQRLSIKGLSKSYGKLHVFTSAHFENDNETLIRISSPNGSGKSTLLRMLGRIEQPQEGELKLDGIPMNKLSTKDLSYLPEEKGGYPEMSPEEHWTFIARLKGLNKKAIQESFIKFRDDISSLGEWATTPFHKLSKGNAQKALLIGAFFTSPKLLLLDEPFSGLDQDNSAWLSQKLMQLAEEGTLVLFSSHEKSLGDLHPHLTICIKNQKIELA